MTPDTVDAIEERAKHDQSTSFEVLNLVDEVRRLRGGLERMDALATRQVGNEPSGGESKRGWIYAHDIFAVLDELEIYQTGRAPA